MKCREVPQHNTTDVTWAIEQLKREVEKYLDRARDIRLPEYYIFCTNVSLSSDPKSGGKARFKKALASHAEKLGLKGWSVWSPDELRVFLDEATEIRRRYTAWLLPSEVLAALVDSLERRNLARLLPLAIARDVREERDARLHDVAQDSEKGIELDSIFIDVPIGPDANRPSHRRVTDRLMERCADAFNAAESRN